MNKLVYRLVLAVIGFAGLALVIVLSLNVPGEPVHAWTRGGAVALAVTGLFGLLLTLGR